MAYLLKKHTDAERGILIFNQKEWDAFSQIKSLPHIRDNYIFGCHVGRFWKNCDWNGSKISQFNFYMSSRNQLPENFPGEIIELNSRNFTPEIFSYLGEVKDIDILWINKPHPVKNIEKFLISLKNLFQTYGSFRTVIVAAISPNELKRPQDFFDVELFIRQNSVIFGDFVTLIRTTGDGNEGAPNHTMAQYFKRSKIFAFYSEAEGESRVVTEALCCGCKIVYFDRVQGGSNDYCNSQNSLQFTNYDDSHLTLKTAIDTFSVPDISQIHQKCHQNNSIGSLIDYFKNELYPKLGLSWINDNLEIPSGKWSTGKDKLALNFSLPGHDHNVPWKHPDLETGDLVGDRKFIDIFLKETGLH
jgi:glycosyltransferase involved in cell wall biosynthesis